MVRVMVKTLKLFNSETNLWIVCKYEGIQKLQKQYF